MTFTYMIPQSDYFEWEDIITDNFTYAQQASYLPDQDCAEKYSFDIKGFNFGDSSQISSPLENNYFHWGESPEPKQSKAFSVTPECVTPKSVEKDEKVSPPKESTCDSELSQAPETLIQDDLDLPKLPVRNVDYFSFPWCQYEVDLWASRKYLKRTKNKKETSQLSERLENASWRIMAMARLRLEKVNPHSFNWLKDQDDTWLLGPFVPSCPEISKKNRVVAQVPSVPKVEISLIEDADELPVKSILKYSPLSELIIRGSIAPSLMPRQHARDTRTHLSRKQRKTLRFASEVKQYLPPDENNKASNLNLSTDVTHSYEASSLLEQAGLLIQHDGDTKHGYISVQKLRPQIQITRSPMARTSSKRSISPTECQAPSTRLRTEQISGEMVASRCLLRNGVGAQNLTTEYQLSTCREMKLGSGNRESDSTGDNFYTTSSQPKHYKYPYASTETDEMDWISGKEDRVLKNLPYASVIPHNTDRRPWRKFKGPSIVVDNSYSILSGLQSPPELTESRSDCVSEDEMDAEMEEYNLILG